MDVCESHESVVPLLVSWWDSRVYSFIGGSHEMDEIDLQSRVGRDSAVAVATLHAYVRLPRCAARAVVFKSIIRRIHKLILCTISLNVHVSYYYILIIRI